MDTKYGPLTDAEVDFSSRCAIRHVKKMPRTAFGNGYAAALHQCARSVFGRLSLVESQYRQRWESGLQKGDVHDGIAFLSLPWHFLTENLQRGNFTIRERAMPFLQLRTIFLNADWRRTHFIVLNQASLRDVRRFYQRFTDEGLVLPPTLLIFESRLLEASTRAVGCEVCPRQFPVPLFRSILRANTTAFEAKHNSVRIFGSIGFPSHNRARPTVARVLHQFRLGISPAQRSSVVVGSRIDSGVANANITNESWMSAKNGTRMSMQSWIRMLTQSTWSIVVSGTYPVSFMIYESIFLGALPVFVVDQRLDLSDMPLADDGVKFNTFGHIVHLSNFTVGYVRRLYNTPPSVIAQMQKRLRLAAKRYSLDEVFQYMLHKAVLFSVGMPLKCSQRHSSRCEHFSGKSASAWG
eukprot:CAMPEP_0119329292 /NCGR_PEP_ID=MMETSP1333-20130426/75487_1 /TAXON_ID=418940 /ORGANISM="Scyphosphaera apsteinii, Strain RCC1455" /LENGTH=408 /DNA_ID=CAMNT_0007338375 /DNA_START=190 /DNA_END=1416 /DNA_ORIENTATION=-